jgi:putative ABC transport system ATP-binding protein
MSQSDLLSASLVAHPEPVLEISRLNHWFGHGDTRSQVLFDVNLDIYQGEIVIMLGPSGSGKTTLLTLIGALRTIQQGNLRVLGQELLGLNPTQLVDVRRRIGFIFQAHNLFSSLTATQNVQLALELREPDSMVRYRRATEVLTSLGLSHRLTYRPEQLSGGLKQRVAIARALANRPRLILADEPTAALDAKSAEVVVEELKKLAKAEQPEERSTILVVTHDEKILGMADRIVTMKHGRIVSNVLKADVGRIVTALKSSPVFARLSDETLKRIASRMGRELFAPNTTIFRQNEEGDRFYLIWQGSVDIIIEKEGTETFRRVLKAGDVFGEKALLSKDLIRTGSAVAREDLELYSMDKRNFAATLAESSTLNEEISKLYPMP